MVVYALILFSFCSINAIVLVAQLLQLSEALYAVRAEARRAEYLAGLSR